MAKHSSERLTAVGAAILTIAAMAACDGGSAPVLTQDAPAPTDEAKAPPAPPTPPAPTSEDELIPGELDFRAGAPVPKNFPQDLPLPEGAEVQGAHDGGDSRNAIEMMAPGEAEELVEALSGSYGEAGWEVTGSRTNAQGEGIVLATKDGKSIMTLIHPADSRGKSVVRTLSIEGTIQ